MHLIEGIHGVGKTTYCKKLQKEKHIPLFNAGQIIEEFNQTNTSNKLVKDIDDNQKKLLQGIMAVDKKYSDYLLDGHLCLLNQEGKIEEIGIDLYKNLNISDITILVDNPEHIRARIQKRNGLDWSYDFIRKFQNAEIAYGRKIARMKKIELVLMQNTGENVKMVEKNNIILPIKPIYVEKILNGEKKYEFRKKLCTRDIKKIYIYATAPVKQIVGEVEVLEKISTDKMLLWEKSCQESGIEYQYYQKYFDKGNQACAYHLGRYKRYEQGISLSDIGIDYVPQSYVYIENINLEEL